MPRSWWRTSSATAGSPARTRTARSRACEALRSDLIDPAIAAHHGRIVKRTGDGAIIEFRSVVDAVRCAIEVQTGLIERNAGVPPERRIEYRVGIHIGDVVEESDGDLMGDGVNIAARLGGRRQARRDLPIRASLLAGEGAARSQGQRPRRNPLKNIAEPIHVYSLEVGQPPPAKPPSSATTADQPKSWRPSAAWTSRRSRPPSPCFSFWSSLAGGTSSTAEGRNRRKPPICQSSCCPFANLSGDPTQDYFADGVTENLTTELSRIHDSFVIARNTAFTYKGKSIDAKEIGKELGVRYVLEGSVQRDQNRVRVNAQLVDAESGAYLWADRFDEDVADLFKLQDEVVTRLARSLDFGADQAGSRKGQSLQKSGRSRSDHARLRLDFALPEGIPRLHP